MHAGAAQAAVSKHLPVLQPGEGVLNPGAGAAVHGVLGLLLGAELLLAQPPAVRDEGARQARQIKRGLTGASPTGLEPLPPSATCYQPIAAAKAPTMPT